MGFYEDLENDYTTVGAHLVASGTRITYTSIASNTSEYCYRDMGAGFVDFTNIYKNFEHTFEVYMSTDTNIHIDVWQVANVESTDTFSMFGLNSDTIYVMRGKCGSPYNNPRLLLETIDPDGVSHEAVTECWPDPLQWDTTYYCKVAGMAGEGTYGRVHLYVYEHPSYKPTYLYNDWHVYIDLESAMTKSYRYFYTLNTHNFGYGGEPVSGWNQNYNLNYNYLYTCPMYPLRSVIPYVPAEIWHRYSGRVD